MNTYDVKCPVCGVVNHSLFLEETDGWMEASTVVIRQNTAGNRRQKADSGICNPKSAGAGRTCRLRTHM